MSCEAPVGIRIVLDPLGGGGDGCEQPGRRYGRDRGPPTVLQPVDFLPRQRSPCRNSVADRGRAGSLRLIADRSSITDRGDRPTTRTLSPSTGRAARTEPKPAMLASCSISTGNPGGTSSMLSTKRMPYLSGTRFAARQALTLGSAQVSTIRGSATSGIPTHSSCTTPVGNPPYTAVHGARTSSRNASSVTCIRTCARLRSSGHDARITASPITRTRRPNTGTFHQPELLSIAPLTMDPMYVGTTTIATHDPTMVQ